MNTSDSPPNPASTSPSTLRQSRSRGTDLKRATKRFEISTPPTNWQMLFKKKRPSKSSPSPSPRRKKTDRNTATTSSVVNTLPCDQTKADLFNNLNESNAYSVKLTSTKMECEAVKVPISDYLWPQPDDIPVDDRILRPLRQTPAFDLDNLDDTDKRYYFYNEPLVISQREKDWLAKAAEIKRLRDEKPQKITSTPTHDPHKLPYVPIPRNDLMKDVVAFCDVRFKKRKISDVIGDHMMKCGATIRKKLTKDVTHVVFNDGLYSVYKKATELNIPLLCLNWIEKCKEANTVLPAEDFPVKSKDFYDDPTTLKPYQRRRDWSPTHQDKLWKQRRQREERKEKKLEEERRLKLAMQEEQSSESEPEPDDPELRQLTYDVLWNCSFTRRIKKRIANRENNIIEEEKGISDLSLDEDEIEEEKAQMAKLEKKQAEFDEVKKAYQERKLEREKRRSLKLSRMNESSSTPVTGNGRSTSASESPLYGTPQRMCHTKKSATKTSRKKSSSKKSKGEISSDTDSDYSPTNKKRAPRKSTNKNGSLNKHRHTGVEQCEIPPTMPRFTNNYRVPKLELSPESPVRRSSRFIVNSATPEIDLSDEKSSIEVSTPDPASTHSSDKTSLKSSPDSDYYKCTHLSTKRKVSDMDHLGYKTSKKQKTMLESDCSPRESLRKSIMKLSMESPKLALKCPQNSPELDVNKMKFNQIPIDGIVGSQGEAYRTMSHAFASAEELMNYELNSHINAPTSSTGLVTMGSKKEAASNENSQKYIMEDELKDASVLGPSDFGIILEGKIKEMVAENNKNIMQCTESSKQVQNFDTTSDQDLDMDTTENDIQIPCKTKNDEVSNVSLNDSLSNFTICQPTRTLVKPRNSVVTKCIIGTNLTLKQMALLKKTVVKRGHFNIVYQMSDKVTHVVTGEPKRTLNVMHGILNGCWILDFEWVESSLQNGSWLLEHQFLTTRFMPAMQKLVESYSSFTCQLFDSCGLIYVTANTCPPTQDLLKLLKKANATVTYNAGLADIIIGTKSNLKGLSKFKSLIVSEQWVLDSITILELQPLQNYLK